MPQGDLVLLRTSGGRPAMRRVWEVRPQEVLVVHDDYYRRNKEQGYCRSVIAPKLRGLGIED